MRRAIIQDSGSFSVLRVFLGFNIFSVFRVFRGFIVFRGFSHQGAGPGSKANGKGEQCALV
jgi:hypothetical protein